MCCCYVLPLVLARRITFLSAFSFISLAGKDRNHGCSQFFFCFLCKLYPFFLSFCDHHQAVAAFVIIVLATVRDREHSTDRDAEVEPAIFSAEGIFRTFAVMAFSFTCHSNVHPIYLETANPTVPRMMRVTWISMAFCFVLYEIASVASYVDYVDSDLVNRKKSKRKDR